MTTPLPDDFQNRIDKLATPSRPRRMPAPSPAGADGEEKSDALSSSQHASELAGNRRPIPLPATEAEAEEQRVNNILKSRYLPLYDSHGLTYEQLRKLQPPVDQDRLVRLRYVLPCLVSSQLYLVGPSPHTSPPPPPPPFFPRTIRRDWRSRFVRPH